MMVLLLPNVGHQNLFYFSLEPSSISFINDSSFRCRDFTYLIKLNPKYLLKPDCSLELTFDKSILVNNKLLSSQVDSVAWNMCYTFSWVFEIFLYIRSAITEGEIFLEFHLCRTSYSILSTSACVCPYTCQILESMTAWLFFFVSSILWHHLF